MTKTVRAVPAKAKVKAISSATGAIARPTVTYMSYAELVTNFKVQVEALPVNGQRNHQQQNASGRAHIKTEVPATTQAVMHAVTVVGKYKLKFKLVLIDGYHRLDAWFKQERCPFDEVLVIVHEIQADTEAEFKEKVDVLASTIDNRAAVKDNADRWCAALRDAGVQAQSKAYQLGTRARTYLNRVLGSAKVPMSQLTEKAKAGVSAHEYMDMLFHFVEQNTSIKCQNEYLHAGVAEALYTQLMKKGVARDRMTDMLNSIYEKLGAKKALAAKVTLNKQQTAVYELLLDLATDERQKDLRSRGNRETYYTEVALELTPALDALRKVCSRGIVSKK